MDQRDWLAEQFEGHRSHLRAVAYRMLGSITEAEDAVQEAWVRLDRSGGEEVGNLRGWLTTVVGRVCLDMLRSRRSRLERSAGPWLPEPIVSVDGEDDPEQEAELADSIGLALLVVLETLTPAERLAFVLHDMFAVPFDEIAGVVGTTTTAARQLASRARRRVQGTVPRADTDMALQRRVVDAFLRAARAGDFDALVAVLAPDVVFRVDTGRTAPVGLEVSGADAVARSILSRGGQFASLARPAIVNGAPGFVLPTRRGLISAVGFTVVGGRIAEIDVIADPDKLKAFSTDE